MPVAARLWRLDAAGTPACRAGAQDRRPPRPKRASSACSAWAAPRSIIAMRRCAAAARSLEQIVALSASPLFPETIHPTTGWLLSGPISGRPVPADAVQPLWLGAISGAKAIGDGARWRSPSSSKKGCASGPSVAQHFARLVFLVDARGIAASDGAHRAGGSACATASRLPAWAGGWPATCRSRA